MASGTTIQRSNQLSYLGMGAQGQRGRAVCLGYFTDMRGRRQAAVGQPNIAWE